MQNTLRAHVAGHRTPINDEARSTGHAAGLLGKFNQQQNSTQAITSPQHATPKAVVTQIAQLALHGHAVHQLRDGAFLVCKYGMTKYCVDFPELKDFARKLGVNQ